MKRSTDWELDDCLRRVLAGEDLQAVLPPDPELAERVRPALLLLLGQLDDLPASRRRESDKAILMAAVAARREAVQATDRYVRLVKRGLPIERLLAQVPETMRLSVVAAHRMHSLAPPPPLHRTAGKRRVMALAARRRLSRRRAVLSLRPLPIRLREVVASVAAAFWTPRPAWASAVAALGAMMVLVGGLAGLNTAAASSVPGQPLYGFKRLGETAKLAFTFDPAERADLVEQFGERRLAEMVAVVEAGGRLSIDQLLAWLRDDPEACQRVLRLGADQQLSLANEVRRTVDAWREVLASGGRTLQDSSLLALVKWAERATEQSARAEVEWPPHELGMAETVVEGGPLPLPRPLPPEDLVPRVSRSVDTPVPVRQLPAEVAPVIQAPGSSLEPPPAPVADHPVVIQPADESRASGRGSGAEPAARPLEPPPTSVPGVSEEPPPFLQPPAVEPATPTPEADSGDTTTP